MGFESINNIPPEEATATELDTTPDNVEDNSAEIPLMITNKMRERLSDEGLSPEEISRLRPEEVREILNKNIEEEDGVTKQKTEQEVLKQHKEELFAEEKRILMQEKLDEFFKELSQISHWDLNSLLESGKTADNKKFNSESMGQQLDPNMIKSLTKAFKEGIKSLPKIIEILPDILKEFNNNLTEEAEVSVEKKLQEEQEKELEEQKKVEQGDELDEEKKDLDSKKPTEQTQTNNSTEVTSGQQIEDE